MCLKYFITITRTTEGPEDRVSVSVMQMTKESLNPWKECADVHASITDLRKSSIYKNNKVV